MSAQPLASIYLHCFDILRLQKNPQDLDVSKNNFYSVFMLYCSVSCISAWIFLSSDVAISFALLDVALLIGFVYLCLFICGFTDRFRQTVTALMGVATVIGILTIPISLVAKIYADIPLLSTLSTFLLLVILLWNIVINGHIFRHAFSILFFGGIAIAILYYLLINAVVIVFVPGYLS